MLRYIIFLVSKILLSVVIGLWFRFNPTVLVLFLLLGSIGLIMLAPQPKKRGIILFPVER